MNSGYVEQAELNQIINDAEAVQFRVALIRDDKTWKVHTLLLEVMPKYATQGIQPFHSNYGPVYFAGGSVAGDIVVHWLAERRGELPRPRRGMPVREFVLAPSNRGKVPWQRLPSHALVDYHRMGWPITRYDVSGGTASNPPAVNGFLIGEGLPFYPDFQTALLSKVYQTPDVDALRPTPSPGPAVIVRVPNTDAWLREITLSPTSIRVSVDGSLAQSSQLTIRGSTDPEFQAQVEANQPIECPLPRGVPSPLWIVVSRGTEWLDYYHRDERYGHADQNQGNVTIDAGDISTEIEGLIYRGEGLTTEFKGDVPKNRDQMLKTIAAFANGPGGVMLLGVRERTGELVSYQGNPDDLMQMIRDNVFPMPVVRMQWAEVEHRRIWQYTWTQVRRSRTVCMPPIPTTTFVGVQRPSLLGPRNCAQSCSLASPQLAPSPATSNRGTHHDHTHPT